MFSALFPRLLEMGLAWCVIGTGLVSADAHSDANFRPSRTRSLSLLALAFSSLSVPSRTILSTFDIDLVGGEGCECEP